MHRDPTDTPPADDMLDESADSLTNPDTPIADKGETTRLMTDTDRPANGRSSTPPGRNLDELPPDAVVDEPKRTEELDLAGGDMDDEVMTQGESVADAEYLDRGPAQLDSGVDASGASDVADTDDGDVMTGSRGVRDVEEASIVDADTSRD